MRILNLFAAAAFATAAYPAAPGLSDRLYNAIRVDDVSAVKSLIPAGANVDVRDSRGTTPLMYAAAVGSTRMMRHLIGAGADVNARNAFEATALMWSTGSLEKVRLLIEKGADVNARSKRGRTPLSIAAAQGGNAAVVRLLLEKGASPKLAGAPLADAAAANDIESVKLLIERGEHPDSKHVTGFTPLMFAAAHGNHAMVKLLLEKGAAVNATSGPAFAPPVKNGPIALGNFTPLLLAAGTGSAGTVRLLLDAGAGVDAKDIRGMTPLMLAVATDRGGEQVVRMLLARKPDVTIQSAAGETALDWAAKLRNPAVLGALQAASPGMAVHKAAAPAIQPVGYTSVAAAAGKGLALMQKSNATFLREGGCISCHAQNITTIAASVARSRPVHYDRAAAAEAARSTRVQFAAFADGLLERLDPPAVEILSTALMALAFDGTEPDRITDAMAHNVAAQQHADGSWGIAGIARPPITDGGFTVTAMGIRSLRDYAPPARKAEMADRIGKAAGWLLRNEPRTTEDTAMKLLGLTWAGMDRSEILRVAGSLRALQRPDGGWAQTPYLESDAYATGLALFALHEAGAARASDAAYQSGVRYLLRTQAGDGSWYVASRAPKFQPYFDGGFPYGHDQWVSQMATGWATAALSLAVPEEQAIELALRN